MIKIENVDVTSFEAAVRGMRNSMNSCEDSDSGRCLTHRPAHCSDCAYVNGWCNASESDLDTHYIVGPKDFGLMTRLRNSGTAHRKFMRMIAVYVDITAPLYWWKEFKTYRDGIKFGDDEPDIVDEGHFEYNIASKEFMLDDFSHEHLFSTAKKNLESTIDILNGYRDQYSVYTNHEMKKFYWWQMVQLLPSSYNQRRTVMLNYEALANIYKSCKNNELDEWHTFCDWVEGLPYSELIIGKENMNK